MYTSINWNDMFHGGVGRVHTVIPVANGTSAKVVEVKGRDRDRSGEAYQGDSECHIIFEVDGRYFKKAGYESSYEEDERSWDGNVTEVFGTTETVTVFRAKR